LAQAKPSNKKVNSKQLIVNSKERGFITELARGRNPQAKRRGFISEHGEETKLSSRRRDGFIRQRRTRLLSAAKGFTLIELILYLGIAATTILAVSALLFAILQSQVKNQTVSEVNQQGMQVMQIITQTIRNAQGINSPSTGSSAASVSLDVVAGADDATVFDLSGGALRITEGAGSAVPLTSSDVVISSLTFQNLTRSGTFGTIRVQFTLTYASPEGRSEYNYSKSFVGSATLRQ
jgi:Tfp pilus assembly protein PilW